MTYPYLCSCGKTVVSHPAWLNWHQSCATERATIPTEASVVQTAEALGPVAAAPRKRTWKTVEEFRLYQRNYMRSYRAKQK